MLLLVGGGVVANYADDNTSYTTEKVIETV